MLLCLVWQPSFKMLRLQYTLASRRVKPRFVTCRNKRTGRTTSQKKGENQQVQVGGSETCFLCFRSQCLLCLCFCFDFPHSSRCPSRLVWPCCSTECSSAVAMAAMVPETLEPNDEVEKGKWPGKWPHSDPLSLGTTMRERNGSCTSLTFALSTASSCSPAENRMVPVEEAQFLRRPRLQKSCREKMVENWFKWHLHGIKKT